MQINAIRAGIALLTALLLASAVPAADKILPHPHVEIVTTEGTFKLELVTKEAPKTVAHFLNLVHSGFYNGLIFHRVIPGFMVQSGGYTPSFKLREDKRTVVNESGNALSNTLGTIAMARTNDPHSANSQFFINVGDNQRLDPQKHPVRGRWGYTVFGYVIEGMDVVNKIAAAQTSPQGEHANAPVVPIVVKKISEVSYE
ncbi:MAG: peptidyl-prolyl cis-trans isomerase [Woeseiaceae bacterium]|nr:peptidyl-prolyl cis-trans isomerase [Woeseiaceae bacterium]